MQNIATVLVVDDTEAQRYTTSYALRKAGFEVIEAATGRRALAMAEQQPDMILLDIVLPDLDGIEVCRRLKSNPATSEIPVIHLGQGDWHSPPA
jgi:CheY-like chemotaxis protein